MFTVATILKGLKKKTSISKKLQKLFFCTAGRQEGAAGEMTPMYIQQGLNDGNSTKNNYTKALIIYPLFR